MSFVASVFFNNEREFGVAVSKVEVLGKTDRNVALSFETGHISVRGLDEVCETADEACDKAIKEIESRKAKLIESYDSLLEDVEKKRQALASAVVVG
jgi:hypothetical protein